MTSPNTKKSTIYADHAATTALSPCAFEAMRPFLSEQYANASQPYSISQHSRRALNGARATIAACIHAEPDEIYFTSGGTESDNWALKSSISKERQHIITSQIEHHAVLRSVLWLKQCGCRVSKLPVDNVGTIFYERLSRLICTQTALVSVMLANNEVGTIQDLETISNIAHAKGTLVHTDAVQAIGHIPVNVNNLGVDLMSASAHKFNGPKGIGFLFKRRGIHLPPLLHGGSQEDSLRAGTENIASIIGMAVALEEQCRRLKDYRNIMVTLEDLLIQELHNRNVNFHIQGPDISTPGSRQKRLPGLLSISFPGHKGESLLHLLDLHGVCVSTGSACDSRNTTISHVLKAMHITKIDALGTIRISLGYENTPNEIMTLADVLSSCLKLAAR